MRMMTNRHIRRCFITASALLVMYAIAVQLILGSFSPVLLLLSVLASAALLWVCRSCFKKQDSLMEDAVNQINRFLSGQRDQRIECNEEGELFRLFNSINTLSAVLDAQTEREKQRNAFLKATISDISHQLKTPLSALGIYNELIAGTDDMDEVRRFSADSEAELERIDTLVKNLLKLARLDAGAITFERHPENMAEIMENLKQRFTQRAALEKKELRLSGCDEVFPCDAVWLTEAFGNIIKNALDHTSAGDTICLEWKKNGNMMTVNIRDNGCGIHPEDMEHIFKRFYRSRFSKDIQGIGLGLPLAKTIIEAHDGIIEADSELGHGTVFSVIFLIPTEL